MNSVSEGLYFGVPLIIVPQAVDQHIVAQRVQDLRAGLVLNKYNLTPDLIRRAVTTVMEDSALKDRATVIAHSFRQAGGFTRAADALLDFVRTSEGYPS